MKPSYVNVNSSVTCWTSQGTRCDTHARTHTHTQTHMHNSYLPAGSNWAVPHDPSANSICGFGNKKVSRYYIVTVDNARSG